MFKSRFLLEEKTHIIGLINVVKCPSGLHLSMLSIVSTHSSHLHPIARLRKNDQSDSTHVTGPRQAERVANVYVACLKHAEIKPWQLVHFKRESSQIRPERV